MKRCCFDIKQTGHQLSLGKILYLCLDWFKDLKKKIDVIFLKDAEDYFNELPKKVKDKFTIAFYKTKHGYKGEWFEKLQNTAGIFEFKRRDQHKFYRIFAFWDSDFNNKTLIVGTHGIDKKTNKTPTKEIKKAEAIKRKYFNSKKRNERN